MVSRGMYASYRCHSVAKHGKIHITRIFTTTKHIPDHRERYENMSNATSSEYRRCVRVYIAPLSSGLLSCLGMTVLTTLAGSTMCYRVGIVGQCFSENVHDDFQHGAVQTVPTAKQKMVEMYSMHTHMHFAPFRERYGMFDFREIAARYRTSTEGTCSYWAQCCSYVWCVHTSM